MTGPSVGAALVGFDKGSRVPRLEQGAVLDGRQAGILFAGLRAGHREAELVEWDRAQNPGLNARIEALLATKGPGDKQTLLLALSIGLLRRFTVRDHDEKLLAELEGDRGRGYAVVRVAPM